MSPTSDYLIAELNDKVWPVLRGLARIRGDKGEGEPELRKLLRPHAEVGFGPDEAFGIEMRRKVDVALGTLTRLEIFYELDLAAPPIPSTDVQGILEPLFRSEAFLRYVNYYLYFGVRFLAGRLSPADSWLKLPAERLRELRLVRLSNERPFELAPPPPIDYSPFRRLGARKPAAVERYVQSRVESFARHAMSLDPARNWHDLNPVTQALDFLDGAPAAFGEEPEGTEKHESETICFELWLRGLRPELTFVERERFPTIAFGLFRWAIDKSDFYHSLPPVPRSSARTVANGHPLGMPEPNAPRPLGGWRVDNPAAARIGLADMYWIASLLRAEVSADATVKYSRSNWLHLLRQNAVFISARLGETAGAPQAREIEEALWRAEEILRSVFDFTCELVQNALEITNKKEQQAYEHRPLDTPVSTTVGWRQVSDEELEEIERERCLREFQPAPPAIAPADDGWSRRVKTGEHPPNLIGLAFSGGGIRSATFNLGVLQGLQRLDLLRKIDFLSTVSGGGFIGAWLIGNVCRTQHWLGSHMKWDESISHLRRYSNYLSPRTGVLSTDTWTMWASWWRNALLIQLTGVAWLLTLLSFGLLLQRLFQFTGTWDYHNQPLPGAGLIAALCTGVLSSMLVYNLWKDRAVSGKGKTAFRTARWVRYAAIAPASLAAFLLSSLLWTDAGDCSWLSDKLKGSQTTFAISYSQILRKGLLLPPWWLLFGGFFAGLCVLSFVTLSRLRQEAGVPQANQPEQKGWRIWHSFWIGLVSVLVFYLEVCGIVRLFMGWGADPRFNWYAFVLGPPLVLAACTVSVVIFIGLCGRNSNESIREWWTRFGTWLGIYGFGYLVLTGVAVFGPPWTLQLFHRSDSTHPALIASIKWGSVISWIGTVMGGLFAGKSSKTSGAGVRSKSPLLEIVANLGGLLFIIGAILVAATVLYVLLFNIALDVSADHIWKYWDSLNAITQTRKVWWLVGAWGVTLGCGVLFSRYFEINIFGLNQFYRNRLVRCYLGASRWAAGYRQPQPFTKFDGRDDMKLWAVLQPHRPQAVQSNVPAGAPAAPAHQSESDGQFRGPYPIYNCSLNLAGSSDLSLHTRHSASFTLTPKRCGADREKVGYAPADRFANGVMLGQAVAISGAAASPNMGYNTSPLVALLLTMFNVRLGWWFPNPSREKWNHPGLNFSLWYLVKELFGVADETSDYVNVSDGGHFENLGIYELVRRGCKVIIAGDAECDEALQFGSLGNVVRLCETDFGAKIDINVNSIRLQQNDYSLGHCTVGKITYRNGSIGYLIYLKASVTGDEEVGITQYRSIHPSFPHETTADQFFSEDQFESYRQLGVHVVQHSLRSIQGATHPVEIAEKLFDVLTPAGCASDVFLKHTKTLDTIWERFRSDARLRAFMDELEGLAPAAAEVTISDNEILLGLEIIQLIENVFLDLRLDDFWDHPDNRGWAVLFMRWAGSPKLRAVWMRWRSTFGIRFEHFCDGRLGLPRERHTVRV